MLWFSRNEVHFRDLGLARDVHCHILPGVDDGVRLLPQAREVLSVMYAAGIRNLTLTPHMNPDIYLENTEESIKAQYDSFIENLKQSGGTGYPNLRLGGEYMVTNEFHRRDASEMFQFLPGKILIEMSYYYYSRNIEEAIFNIVNSGLTPVMAHPERYLYLAGNLSIFEHFHDMGCEFQMNILSLSGVYGSASVRILEYLMKNRMYSYLGTDTHALEHFHALSGISLRRKYIPYVKELIENQNGI